MTMVTGCDLYRPPACGGQVSSGQLSHQRYLIREETEQGGSKSFKGLQDASAKPTWRYQSLSA